MKKRWIALLCAFLLMFLSACRIEFSNIIDAASSSGGSGPETSEAIEGGGLTVWFLDVGQGDCTLVQSGGESMLIDCGGLDTAVQVEQTLRRCGAERLRYLVATHDHSDHAGAAGALIERLEVGEILHSPLRISGEGYDYGKMFTVAAERGIPARAVAAGDTFSLGEAEIAVLAPGNCDPSNVNNSSVVLKITCGSHSLLIASDAERESEREMLLSGADLSADLLRLGHHGSASSTSYRFLRRVAPQYAVISVAAENPYGHPAEAVLSRISDCAVTLYRTDVHGDICFIAGEGGFSVKTQTGQPAYLPECTQPEPEIYIGNRKSMVFHAPDCKNLPSEQNRVFFESAEEAAEAGYSPCGSCNP